MSNIEIHGSVLRISFGGGGTCHRVAEHIRRVRPDLTSPAKNSAMPKEPGIDRAKLGGGGAILPAVQRQLAPGIDRAKLGGGGGILPAVQRQLAKTTLMGASGSPAVKKHLDQQR